MFGSPDETPYDLRFRLFGIPVRVHPLFWLVMCLISGDLDNLKPMLIFVVCAFISIVVHEMGHGLAARLMGEEPLGIVLYSMGGYCAFQRNQLTPWRRIFVLLAGPGAGFVLLAIAFGLFVSHKVPETPTAQTALGYMLYINLVWGVLNLLPLWPLDGGQITSTFLSMFSARNGMRWGHVISLLVAGCLAILCGYLGQWFMAIWFGYFGVINYQLLQAMHYSFRSADDSQWWRQ